MGEKTSGKATYAITQADIDAGIVKNTATAKAEDVDGNKVESNESEHDVEIEGTSALAIEKTVDRDVLDGRKSELDGTRLTYSFTVTNTGTTTVSGISIDDAMKGLGDIEYGGELPKAEALGFPVSRQSFFHVMRACFSRTHPLQVEARNSNPGRGKTGSNRHSTGENGTQKTEGTKQ